MAGSPSLAMISPAATVISSPCSRQLLSSDERPANKGSFCNSSGFICAASQRAFTLSSQRSGVCNSAVSVLMAPTPSHVLGSRPPVLLVLLDQKIHKPEHPENPPCENPGKQWPSHGVLLIVVRSHVLSSEYGNDRSSIGQFQIKGKTIMERGFSKNIRSLVRVRPRNICRPFGSAPTVRQCACCGGLSKLTGAVASYVVQYLIIP